MPARILIVEDERVTAEDLRDTLTDLGYSVTAAVSSAADAIEQAEGNPPDIALMDIRIQGEMDGTLAAVVLRERFNIPVIYLTAHVDSATVGRAKESGPIGYITKPFQAASLHASIEIALHRHREDLKTREKGELLASTLRAISEAVISVDLSKTITLFNPAAEVWTGRSSREALGQPVEQIFEAATRAWEQVLSDGSFQELPADMLVRSKDGQKRPISGAIAPIRDHKGEVAGAVLVFGRDERRGERAVSNLPAAAEGARRSDGINLGGFKMIAASPAMKQVLVFARRVAQSRGIHHPAGRRKRYRQRRSCPIPPFLRPQARGSFCRAQLRSYSRNAA